MEKTGALLLVGLGITILTMSAKAQPSTDPSYSEHNYKHPNKASEMKKQKDARPELYLQEVKRDTNNGSQENNLGAEANYKCISAEKSRTKEFRPSNTASAKPFHLETGVNNNYHQRFSNTRKPASKSSKENMKTNSLAEAKK